MGLARLNPDGSLDPSFTADPRLPAGISQVIFQPDGKMLAASYSLLLRLKPDGKLLIIGDFVEIDGVIRTNLARLNPDGSVCPVTDRTTAPP